MNTKKLNAGIAWLCLENLKEKGIISESDQLELSKIATHFVRVVGETDVTDEDELIQSCIALIQDYLRSVSTEISIGDRVEVLEDAPRDSDTFYDQGEVGIVVRMLEESCIVQVEHGEWDSAEIPFSSLKKSLE